MKLLGLFDNAGDEFFDHCIIHGKVSGVEGTHYWNVYKHPNESIEMIACTYGYVHNVVQEHLIDVVLIGSTEENKRLLECD